MLMVVIALLPTTIFGIYNFGPRALLLILLSVATCVLTEYVYEKLMKKPVTVKDFSAVVTGLLLALNLPASVSWFVPVIGGIFAILIVKQLFGGLGQNFMNPALAARCFLLISFSGQMTDFSVPKGRRHAPCLAEKRRDSRRAQSFYRKRAGNHRRNLCHRHPHRRHLFAVHENY